MDIVQYKRELEFQKVHMNALRKVKPMTDSSPPISLQYTHLNRRAKKQQMMDDRKYEIAMENRKLMVKMTEILVHPSKQNISKSSLAGSSRMEMYRKHEIQKINYENSQIFNRLKNVSPILKKTNFDTDYQRHQELRTLIKKKQLRPMSLSPIKSNSKPTTLSYFSNVNNYYSSSGNNNNNSDNNNSDNSNDNNLSYESLFDFRKRVITSAKAPNIYTNSSHHDVGVISKPFVRESLSESQLLQTKKIENLKQKKKVVVDDSVIVGITNVDLDGNERNIVDGNINPNIEINDKEEKDQQQQQQQESQEPLNNAELVELPNTNEAVQL